MWEIDPSSSFIERKSHLSYDLSQMLWETSFLLLGLFVFSFYFSLGDVLTDDSIQPLLSILQQDVLSSLRFFYIRENKIKDKGVIQLIDALNDSCPSLRSLGLSCDIFYFWSTLDNDISDLTLKRLIQLFQDNGLSSLTELQIRCNNFVPLSM